MPHYQHSRDCHLGGYCGLCEAEIDRAEARRDERMSDADWDRWESGPGWNNIDALRGA